jgi:flagellar basal body-associated protein FliL
MLKNKKSSAWVIVVVFLVLTVCIVAIFTFMQSSNILSLKISNSEMKEIYLNENNAEFQISKIAENTLQKIYLNYISEDKFIKNPVYNANNEVKFESLQDDLDRQIKSDFEKQFNKEISNYQSINKNLIKYEVTDNIGIIAYFNFNKSDDLKNISYSPKIEIEIPKVLDFQKLYDTKQKCNVNKECFNKNLIDYNTEIIKKKLNEEEYYYVILTSKKDYIINDEIKNIKFGFVIS